MGGSDKATSPKSMRNEAVTNSFLEAAEVALYKGPSQEGMMSNRPNLIAHVDLSIHHVKQMCEREKKLGKAADKVASVRR